MRVMKCGKYCAIIAISQHEKKRNVAETITGLSKKNYLFSLMHSWKDCSLMHEGYYIGQYLPFNMEGDDDSDDDIDGDGDGDGDDDDGDDDMTNVYEEVVHWGCGDKEEKVRRLNILVNFAHEFLKYM